MLGELYLMVKPPTQLGFIEKMYLIYISHNIWVFLHDEI